MKTLTPDRLVINGEPIEGSDSILTNDALDFILRLESTFGDKRKSLLI